MFGNYMVGNPYFLELHNILRFPSLRHLDLPLPEIDRKKRMALKKNLPGHLKSMGQIATYQEHILETRDKPKHDDFMTLTRF